MLEHLVPIPQYANNCLLYAGFNPSAVPAPLCPPGPAKLHTHPPPPSYDTPYPLPRPNFGPPTVFAPPIARYPSAAVVRFSAGPLRLRSSSSAFGGLARGVLKRIGRLGMPSVPQVYSMRSYFGFRPFFRLIGLAPREFIFVLPIFSSGSLAHLRVIDSATFQILST
ncbi:hypothetical protein C8J57DRAFT_1492061 [Mycena rebaudengoi]|nr:hypothetical protein C8J57DRAFT_1492061 [Mycena rebaudengoi]